MARRGLLLAFAVVLALVGALGCKGDTKLTITEIYPVRGPYTGGDPVTIHGTGFQTPSPQGVKVYFGKRPAKPPVIMSDTELRVEPPAGEINQVVDIDVVFDDARSAKLPQAYKYVDPIAPKQ